MTVSGIVANGAVPEALRRILRLCGADVVAVVRAIDSAISRDKLVEILSFNGIPHEVRVGNVCLGRAAMETMLAEDLFNGFDELWLFEEKPPDEDLAHVPHLTSDARYGSIDMPASVLDAFATTGCFAALGDGYGVHYIVRDHQVADEITRHSDVESG